MSKTPIKLEYLSALLRDNEFNPDTANPDQLARYLESVEMTSAKKCFEQILKKAKATQRLEIAREKRLAALQKVKAFLGAGASPAQLMQEHIRTLIEKIRQINPAEAQVYAREFEKATPEDLKVLEENLVLLEMDLFDEQSDKQD